MVRRWLAVGILLTLVPIPGRAQEMPAAEHWTGCWDVEWGEWSPPIPVGDSLRYLPAPRIELTADSATPRWSGVLQQRPAPGSLPTPHPFTHWKPLASDSLRVAWSDGHTGTIGRFQGRGDTLHGELATFVDVIPHQKHRSDAALVRVSCEAPPEVPASAQRHVVRSVPLAGGDTVALGEPLPDGRVERFNVTAYVLQGSPTGLFEGARDVRVRVTWDGEAADIRMTYDPAISLDSVVAAFRDSLGPPTSRQGETSVSWENRTTDLRLRSKGSESYLYLRDPRLDWVLPEEHRPKSGPDTARSGSSVSFQFILE